MFEQSQVTTYSATLLGAKQFKGEIDGNKIDSCTVLVASPCRQTEMLWALPRQA